MTRAVTRHPQFAGSWYPNTLEEAERYVVSARQKLKATGIVCPHAGWMFSGKVSGEVFGAIEPADTYVVLAPNHTGQGRSDTALYADGVWKLPQNEIEVDAAFAADLLKSSEFLADDPDSHLREHAIEVQLPFLLLSNPKAKVVPIIMRDADRDIVHDLGRALAAVCKKNSAKRVLLVATTDMTHYEPAQMAVPKDRGAIERMEAVDADGLKQMVDNLGVSMCGLGPVAAMLSAAKFLGAKAGKLIRYATSGDATGDLDSVVGYAGVVVH